MRLRVRDRLLAGFGVIVLLAVAIAAVGIVEAQSANSETAAIFERDVKGLEELNTTLNDVVELRQIVLKELITEDSAARAAQDSNFAPLDKRMADHFDSLKKTWTSPTKLQALATFRSAWDVWVPLRDQERRLVADGRTADAKALALGAAGDAFTKVNDTITQLIVVTRDVAGSRYARARHTLAVGRNLMLTVAFAAMVLGLFVALRLSKRIAGGVATVADAAAKVARGDLYARAEVDTGDELQAMAEAFNAMTAQLRQMVDAERETTQLLQDAVDDYSRFAAQLADGNLGARVSAAANPVLQLLSQNLNDMAASLGTLSLQVRDGVQMITSSASEILASVSQHTTSAREQSAAIAETSATADQVRVAAEDSARKAETVADQAQASATASERGLDAMRAILAGMHEIRTKVDEIGRGILGLSARTQQIGEIITLVNDLADQSNLLAVNAAIEAAKAGDQGRGFAVVAAEMHNLADQSKHATTQVRDILADIQQAANQAVLATEQGTKVVETGERLADQAGDVIAKLAEMVQRAAQSSRQIAAAAHQQSVGMEQISTAMRDVGQATEQFVAGAQQSEVAARSLTDVASRLDELTARYRVRGPGGA